MSGALTWFIEMIICSGILYANYYALLRNNRFHSYNRYYLLAAVVLSILVPFVHIPVDFSTSNVKPAALWQTLTAISSVAEGKRIQIAPEHLSLFSIKNALILLYLLIASAILARFVAAIIFIRKLLRTYKAERTEKIYFVNTEEPSTPFSFFKWLFWNSKIELQSDNGQQMFRHELFHIQQRHSWDLTFLELTTAVFWINPIFHLIRKEVKTIHEFLADEFATKENDKWNYAELLLVQVLGSSSNRLANYFFHNQIKRRVAMITSSKTPRHQFFRKLMILPIATLVFVLFAFKVENYSRKEIREPARLNARFDMSGDSKSIALDSYPSDLDTIKPKEKQKTQKADQKELDQKQVESEKEAAESKEKTEAQERLKQLMTEREKDAAKYQEEFKKMMEMSQREAQENQEKLKKLLEQREKESAKYQEQLKKMMEDRQPEAQKEAQEKFKQLMQERQKDAEKLQTQLKEMMMMRQKETEKSQQELKKLLEDRELQMQQLQEDLKKKMQLMQEEKAKKQVI